MNKTKNMSMRGRNVPAPGNRIVKVLSASCLTLSAVLLVSLYFQQSLVIAHDKAVAKIAAMKEMAEGDAKALVGKSVELQNGAIGKVMSAAGSHVRVAFIPRQGPAVIETLTVDELSIVTGNSTVWKSARR